MNKNTKYILILTILCNWLSAQRLIESTQATNIDSIIQLLDKSLITTGILIDKVSSNPSLTIYDGSCNDCLLDAENFKQQLLNLRMSQVTNNPFLDSSQEKYHEQLSHDPIIPIQIANISYNQIKEYALDSSLLFDNNGLIDEGPDSSESPYYVKRFFGISIPVTLKPQGLQFKVDSNFYWSNNNDTLANIEIDLGDSIGFQSAQFGQTLTPAYSNIMPSEVIVRIRLTIGGQTFLALSKLSFNLCQSGIAPTPVSPPWSSPSQFQFGNLVAEKTNIPSSVHASGNVYVKYRSNIVQGNENKFKKPLIIVEGIDFGSYNQHNAASHLMGNFGWCSLWGEDSNNYPQLTKMSQLLNEFQSKNYDIIMLDFKDGAANIKENAFLLETLIKKVNQYKTVDAEANIIIGASMGAIVARYALADMESSGNEHCTRLFVSLDGPHQGANIPIGAQLAIKFLATNGVQEFQIAKEQLADLSKKAARQLLKSQVHNGGANEHLQFYSTLQNLGYPQKCENIAIASGSGVGINQGFSGGAQILDYYYYDSKIYGSWEEAELRVWSTPGRNGDNKIFRGSIGGGWSIFHKYARWDTFITNSMHLDNAPGGIRQVSKEIADIETNGKGDIKSLHDNQAFIATVSALDINTNNLSFDVQQALDLGTLQTPFNEVYFPQNNTFHVEITDGITPLSGDNITFAKEKVNLGQSVSNPILTSIYNYGEKLNNIVSHNLVSNNGVLHLYGNFNDSKSGLVPASGKTHIYRLGNGCTNTDLIIENSAELIIGDGAFANNAEFRISKGSTLTIASNGKLTIENGSKLIIEKGAFLIFQSGQTVTMKGPSSEILIQGKLTMKQNATLSTTNGKLIFDQDIPWITDPITGNPMRDIDSYLDIESGAKLHLIGTNPSFKNQTLLEIRKETIFKDANQDIFDEVLIQNGALEIAPQAFLFVASPLSIIDAEIRSTDPQNFHDGLRIWNGNTINYLRRVNIKNGHPGVLVSGLGSRGHTEFRDCTIELNWDGLKWNGGFHKVLNCSFNSNLRHAIYGQNLNGTSEIFNSNFNFLPLSGISPSGSAIDLQGQEGSLLQASGNTINGFAHGINLDDMDLRAECNTIQNNYIGIKSDNAIVYLNNEASNTIKQNQSAGINLLGDESGGSGIYLLEGNNKFQFPSTNLSTYNHVLGLWNCNQPLSDYTPTMYMDFNYNQFDIPANATVASLFSLSVVSCNNPSTYFAFNADLSQNNNSAPTCGNSVVIDFHPALATLSELPPTFGKVSNGSAFAETPLYQALDQALNKLSFDEYIRDDQDALNDLILILQGTITNSDAHTQAYLNLAYRAMHQALNQAYQQNQLINNEGEPNPPISEIADVCGIADDWLLSLNPADSMDHASIFQLNLDKVHAYRVAGNYDEALAVLTNRANWNFNFTQTQRASYWNCVCQQEKAYFNEEIPAEEFEYGIAQCQSTYAGYTYKRAINPTLIEETLEDNLIAYPQPVSSNLYLEKDLEFDLETTFKVYSLSGAALELKGTSVSGNKVNLDLSNLKPGVYILKVQSSNFNQTLRILKK